MPYKVAYCPLLDCNKENVGLKTTCKCQSRLLLQKVIMVFSSIEVLHVAPLFHVINLLLKLTPKTPSQHILLKKKVTFDSSVFAISTDKNINYNGL